MARSPDLADGVAVVAELLKGRGETILHGAWLPRRFGAALFCVLRRKPYLKMPHGSYDPVRLAYHGWKKRLMGPFERWTLRHAEAVLATCAAEMDWIRAYEPRVRAVELVDLKTFFDLSGADTPERSGSAALHVLYLGRRHPLKGIRFLKDAIRGLSSVELRVESALAGAEKEAAWAWCDVLCLPTLSENFGLVVAEALAHGRRVVVTDGAPAWDPMAAGTDYDGRLVYVRGFRAAANDAVRVELLRSALTKEARRDPRS